MQEKTYEIISEIKKVIHGKDGIIKMMLSGILAKGHVLLEDIPGVGKTTLALAMSRALSLKYGRVQFTPDVMPGDLLGFNMYDPSSSSFKFVEGSVYVNLFLADEINRTSPKTQSALLEVMEEGRATVEGKTRNMPDPFFVIATQNPFGSSGTQKLPESQLDRFMICLTMGYPDRKSAIDVLKGDSKADIEEVRPVVSAEDILVMQKEAGSVFVDDSLYDYIVRICEQTRDGRFFEMGLSPRASIALMKMAMANAYLRGSDHVIPEDIHEVFFPVSCHRLKLNPLCRADGTDLKSALDRILDEVCIPKIN
ncbi:MAG: MoxR family ATPase [Lachnospiraceae bacterium]|nr:MoxR family ATPase [Lachnospiraceae bacterium]